MTATSTGGPSLKHIRRIREAPEKVFEAFVDPREMVHWWCPDEGPTLSAETDLRVGGSYLVEGKNGFVCFVDRSWSSDFDDPGFWNPKVRGPLCMNAPAVRSILPLQLKRTELALSGVGREQLLERMKDAIAKRELSSPEVGAMSYMMSKQQYLNDGDTHWHPHLMFYMPGDMNPSAWGANLPSVSAVYGGGSDLPGGGRPPSTIFFVPVPMWSDGTPAEMKHHS